MAKPQFKLDSAGISELLKSRDFAAAVHDAAEQVAARVRSHESMVRHELTDTVVVDDYTTDRAASSVTIAHPAGLGMEAKHGVLTRAAGGSS